MQVVFENQNLKDINWKKVGEAYKKQQEAKSNTGTASRPTTSTGNTATRPSTSTSNTNTGSRPSSTSNSNTGSRPSSTSNSNTGSRPSSSSNTNTGSRPATSTSSNASYIKEYLSSTEYKNKEKAKALVECTSEALQALPEIIVNSEGAFKLEKKERKNTINSEDFFGADPGVVFPGNLVYVNTRLADGDPVPCNFAPGKVRLTINKSVPGGQSYADVINDYSHVHQQIVNWLQKIGTTDASYDAEGTTSYYSSASHMATDLKVSASYLKNNAKVDMSTSTDELKIIAVENFSQKFYTVSASAINNDQTSLFGSDVKAATIRSGVNSNGPIGIISSVSYGRRAYRFREYHSKDFTFKGDESLSVNVGGASGSLASTQNVTNSNKTSKFWAFVQSGNSDDKEIFYNNDANNGNSDFMKTVNKTISYSSSNIGVPRNFTVRFIGNNDVAKRSSTDHYYDTEYIPCPKQIRIEIHKDASQVAQTSIQYKLLYKVIHVTKSKNREGETVYKYQIWDTPHNGKYAKDTDTGYADYTRKNFSQGEERITRTIPSEDLEDHENCYIYDVLSWRLEGNHSSGQKWSKWDGGKLSVASLPDDPSGIGKRIYVYIGGSNYAGKNPYILSKSTGQKTETR